MVDLPIGTVPDYDIVLPFSFKVCKPSLLDISSSSSKLAGAYVEDGMGVQRLFGVDRFGQDVVGRL